MKTMLLSLIILAVPLAIQAQVNSGSDGNDGPLDFGSLSNLGYPTNIIINMADHPNGIYQYTYIRIPTNVTVSFIPNTNNTPVYWLVQSNVVIDGTVNVSGQSSSTSAGGLGGPGGWRGGNGGSIPANGQGPGGGPAGQPGGWSSAVAGPADYCNAFLIPLLGGSGGGAVTNGTGGGGGGGAILIAASQTITINGSLTASGGQGLFINYVGIAGGGSGGAVRLVATKINGLGNITADYGYPDSGGSAKGRIRLDSPDINFGTLNGVASEGYQPIIFTSSSQSAQLMVASIGGVSVSVSPTGQTSTPDAILSAQQTNPIPVIVNCANLPLHTLITVSIKPANSSALSATGYNDTGTQSSSTATIPIVIPRGGGLIYATATTSN